MTAVESSPKDIGKRWFEEVWNQRNANAIDDLLAEGARGHMEGQREVVGKPAFKEFHGAMLKALPDLRIQIRDVLADDTNVCVHWTATASHTGAAFGLVATGKQLTFNGMSWFRIENGCIAEGWDCWNQDALFAQMAQAA